MRTHAVMLALVAVAMLAVSVPARGDTYVIPVVTSGVGGEAGSYWESEVRIVKLALAGEVTVRRLWVGLEGGGFWDTSPSPPSWRMEPTGTLYMLVLTGADLLAGSGASIGAVGLEIEGKVDVYLHVANTAGQSQNELPFPLRFGLFGSGQTVRLTSGALQGPSRATWVSVGHDLFRANFGLVNPNPVPIRVRVELTPYYPEAPAEPTGWKGPWRSLPFAIFEIPSFGWVHLTDPYETVLCQRGTVGSICGRPAFPSPAAFRFLPETDDPYVAYVSLVYEPTNDPEFIPVLPGDFDLQESDAP